jgi:hypothetical protein
MYVIGADRLNDLDNITAPMQIKKYVQMELDYKYNDLILITFMNVLIIITLQSMVFLPFYI